jgi:Pentapeptide repeats (9 copies)
MYSDNFSFLCLLAWLGLLQTEVALGDEPDQRYRGEGEIRKQVIQDGTATPSAPDDLVRGAFVSDLIRELSLSEKSALPQVRISGITVEGDVRLTDLDVWSKIRFEACVFKGSVFLTNTAFRRGLSCHICTFEESASFEGVKVEGSPDFEYTKFNNSVTFRDASIGGDLKMVGSRFRKSADFQRMHVGSDLCLDDANFFGAAFFNHGSLKFFLLRNTSFRGNAETNFDNLKVGEDALVKAFFCGPVRWNYGDAKGVYFKGSHFFKRFGFNSNKVSNSVSFQDCDLDRQFICRSNKIDDDLDTRDAHFKSRDFYRKINPRAVRRN